MSAEGFSLRRCFLFAGLFLLVILILFGVLVVVLLVVLILVLVVHYKVLQVFDWVSLR